jgi:hypothetical protein
MELFKRYVVAFQRIDVNWVGVSVSVVTLALNGSVLAEVGISGQKLSTYHKSTIEAETLMIPLMPPFWQTPVISSLSISRIFNN